MKTRWVLTTLALGLGLTLVLLWLLGRGMPYVACAQGPDGYDTYYVAPGGDCGGVIPCFGDVQAAVDAVDDSDDIVKVAAGTYTGVQNVPGLNTATLTATQMVVITKNVTIRGGYTTSDWNTSDANTNRTTLDAQGQGRVLYITGDISPTVEGLRMTGGDATGLGGDTNPRGTFDAGGGVYVITATATISHCAVFSNVASTASEGYGGGLHLRYSDAILNGNEIQSNVASAAGEGAGGGVHLWYSDAVLGSNVVQDNIASLAARGQGGGLGIWFSAATLNGNVVQDNIASTATHGNGGGLYIARQAATVLDNIVQGNVASTIGIGRGGGVYLFQLSEPFTLTNNLIAGNDATAEGSGLWFGGDSGNPTAGVLLQTTIADNQGGDQGVYVGDDVTLGFTNTIIAGHDSVGIAVTAGSMVTMQGTLWYVNGAHTGGAGSIYTGTVNVYGNPAFVNPAAWNYHLSGASAAIDSGVDAGVATDIDGEARDASPDIGADEVVPVVTTIPSAGDGLSAPDGTIIVLPANAVTDAVVLAYSPQPPTATGTLTGPGVFFDLTAVYSNTGQPATIQPGYRYTITVQYNEANLTFGLNEANLALYYCDSSQWVKEQTSAMDTGANTITAAPDHFSLWAALGKFKIYLPVTLKNH